MPSAPPSPQTAAPRALPLWVPPDEGRAANQTPQMETSSSGPMWSPGGQRDASRVLWGLEEPLLGLTISLPLIFPITEQPPGATVSPAPPEVPSVQVAWPQ